MRSPTEISAAEISAAEITAAGVTTAVLAAQAGGHRALHPLIPGLAGLQPAALLAAVAAEMDDAWSRLGIGTTAAQALREQHAVVLGLDPSAVQLRSLYPGLDRGVYACSHSMGVPSVVGPAAVLHQLAELAESGIGVWDDGAWGDLMDSFRQRVAELVGGNLVDGDVAWFPNVSEALGAVLESVPGGSLVYTAGHFTTGHYVHHQWAQNSGGTLVEVPVDADGSVPTERVLAALGPDVRVVSLSHALFESGWLQDLPAIAAAVRERCPDAMLLVDAYQTAGTVPIDATALGDHVLVTAGGHKQLRSATGAGFLYVPRRWLRGANAVTSRRTGWWGHASPFAFEKGPVRRAEDATRLRSGTPTVSGMAMLLGELAAASSVTGGDLGRAVERARTVTRGLVDVAMDACARHGLRVRGDWSSARRAAFVCVEVSEGALAVESLARQGMHVDFRPRTGGAREGWLRVSGNPAGFAYEIEAVIGAIGRHQRTA